MSIYFFAQNAVGNIEDKIIFINIFLHVLMFYDCLCLKRHLFPQQINFLIIIKQVQI